MLDDNLSLNDLPAKAADGNFLRGIADGQGGMPPVGGGLDR